MFENYFYCSHRRNLLHESEFTVNIYMVLKFSLLNLLSDLN